MDAPPARLPENSGIAFVGDALRGPFELTEAHAFRLLAAPNPHGKPNRDVIRPWVGVPDVLRIPRRQWVIDFAPDLEERQAALYRLPFACVRRRIGGSAQGRRRPWWIHGGPQPAMRIAIARCSRFIVTPAAGPRRVFSWLPAETLPERRLIVFVRDDDWSFGVLHSNIHRVWALRQGTRPAAGTPRFRYSPAACFETFPFPWPPATPLGKLTRAQEEQRTAIAQAARALDAARHEWLGDRSDPRRTLTALYNARPSWLQQVHSDLDAAVAAAFGWPADLADEEILTRLLALNRERAGLPPGP